MRKIISFLSGTEPRERKIQDKRVESKRDVEQAERWAIELNKGDGVFYREAQRNRISINRYNLITFLPIVLLRNLLRYGNLFYLGVLLIMLIQPDLSPYYRWIVVFPLGLYIILNALKELFLDYIRQKEYNCVNLLPTRKGAKTKGGMLEENIYWKDLEIGSIVLLKRDEICPADIVVLDTNLVKNRENVCYVDTQIVDGRISYDKKKAANLTRVEKKLPGSEFNFSEYRKRLNGKLEYSAPSRSLKSFDGYLKLKKDPKPEQLNIENLIMRGSILRNTEWIVGLVVYAGKHTKYMLNSNYNTSKFSYFEGHIRRYILCTIFFVLILSAVSVIVYRARSTDLEEILQLVSVENGLKFFSYIILYSPFVPIALYGTMDIIYLLQRFKLQRKFALLAKKDPKLAVKVLNPDSLSSLGQVSYCLIDKTGTLTTGDFKVKRITTTVRNYTIEEDITTRPLLKTRNDVGSKNAVDGKNLTEQDEEYLRKYGHKGNSLDASVDINFAVNDEGEHYFVNTDIGELKFKEELEHRFLETEMNPQHTNEALMTQGNEGAPLLKQNKPAVHERDPRPHYSTYVPTRFREIKPINASLLEKHNTKAFIGDLTSNEQNLKDLSEGLSLCHSSRSRYLTDVQMYHFESANPEEVTLLKLARSMGYAFDNSNRPDNPSIYRVTVNGKQVEYNVLGVNEFSYTRMRQSICIREPNKGNAEPAILYVKGSDASMKCRIKFTQAEIDVYNSLIEENNAKGLKTVVVARRILSPEEGNEFYKKYQNFKGSLYNQDEGLDMLADEYENKLELLGVIGLQDEPREGAMQLLEELRSSDIKCWMVTGDGQDQAVSTGYLFGFVDSQHETYYINPGDYTDVRGQVRNILAQIKRTFDEREGQLTVNSSGKTLKSLKSSMANKRSIGGKDREIFKGTVVVSGEAFKVILGDEYLYSNFAFITSVVGTVVAHSLTPEHKKRLVQMIQTRLVQPQTVMSIGDGLNDVPMLQAADIGVEISSMNVKHPVNAGDIKITDFAPLKEILHVDGRDFSNKVQQSVHFMFYKTYLLALPLFFFNWYCSFTGTAMFESMMIFLYPFLFTYCLLIVYNLVSSNESSTVLRALPALYLDGRIQRIRAYLKFLFEAIIKSLIHSGIIFYLAVYCVHISLGRDGKSPEFDIMALLMYYAIVAIAVLDSTLLFKHRNKWKAIFPVIFSLVMLLCYIFINEAAQFVPSLYTSTTQHVFDRAPSVLVLAFAILSSLGLSYLIRDYLFVKLFETFYEYFRGFFAKDRKAYGKPFENAVILRQGEIVLKKTMEIASIVSSVYVQNETIDSLVHEMLTAADFSNSDLGMNPITLKFQNNKYEKKYRRLTILANMNYLRVVYYFIIAIFSGYTIGQAILEEDARLWIVRVVFIGCFFVLGFLLCTKYIHRNYDFIAFSILFLVFGFKILNDWLRQHDTSLSTGLMALISVTNFNIPVIMLIMTNIVHMIDWIVRILILYAVNDPFAGYPDNGIMTFYFVFSLILILISITAVALYNGFNNEKQKRNEFLANTNLQAQQQKNGDILSLLVPKFVKDKLDKGVRTMADDQGEVAVLFVYLYEFDKIVNVERTNIVRILDSIFREFDKICLSNGCQKIETVMNTYMACAGLKSCEYNVSKAKLEIHPVKRLLEVSFQMREFMESVTYGPEGKNIKLKLGINYGRVIAGVIGFHKPQFSLIGDTVNTTSRVCSTGLVSRITISGAAYTHVNKGEYHFAYRQVQAKGKGHIDTYIVEKHVAKKNKVNQRFKAIITRHRKTIHEMFLAMNQFNNNNEVNSGLEKQSTIFKKTRDQEKRIQGIQIDAKLIKARIAEQIALDEKIVPLKPEDKESFVQEIEKEEQYDDDTEKLLDHLLRPNKFFLTLPKKTKVQEDGENSNPEFDKYKKAESTKEFYAYQYDQNKNFRFFCNAFLFVIYFIQTIVLISARSHLGRDETILILRGVFLFILLVLLIFRRFIQQAWCYYAIPLYLYGIIVCNLQFYYSEALPYSSAYAEVQVIETAFLYLIVSNCCGLSFLMAFFVTLGVIIIWVITYALCSALTIGSCFFFFTFILFGLMQVWINRDADIRSYNNLLIRNHKTDQQAGLVSQLLPAHAAEKYFNDPSSKNDILDVFEEVTLLFADVAGFTAYSSKVEPSKVVDMVSALFTKFDKHCVKFGLYKVYTIGDCYVAMGFINKDKRNPAREAHNMMQMATEMVKIIVRTRDEIKFDELDMRIGIHTGTLVGGITGTDIVRYDIYGEDVSIANKMESEGKKGYINVSERTRFWLEKAAPGAYHFDYHTTVNHFNRNVPSYITHEVEHAAPANEIGGTEIQINH
mmetsp:Transcript_42776/g.49579  ORF Transcript_42776/g.49579 Transcript_42776/m.49579 type:complete len:2326 (+) Transcript_42776:18-6995(+)